MQVQLKPWGNSQGIRISKENLALAGIREDDLLEMSVMPNRIIIRKPSRHKTLRERAEAYGGQLNLSGEYDWGEPAGSEGW